MKLKTLSLLCVVATLSACNTPAVNLKKPSAKAQQTTSQRATQQITVAQDVPFNEPELAPAFYALNPLQYSAPPAFEVALKQAYAQNATRLIVPTTNSNQRAMSFANGAQVNQLDVTEIDDFINLLEGRARHYPAQFASRNERRGFERKLKQVINQLEPLAVNPSASFDVLLRAYKVNVMARNLDLGQIYSTKSLDYGQRLVQLNPNDGELNLWFGFSLAEGGAQAEAIPYLQKAINANVQEAYLSLVNVYLGLEQKKNAINTLNQYKAKYPTESQVVEQLIRDIQSNIRWNVWQVIK